MAGFIYNGHSTEDFLVDDITVGFFDGSSGYGVDREMERGVPTLFRPIPNEYGALDNPAQITFTLVKCGAGYFTKQEQVKVETWLTAPKLSIPLYFIPSGKKSVTGPTPYYYGIFTRTEWIPGGKGFQGVNLTFQPTTAYPYMKGVDKINLKGSEVTKKIMIPIVNPDEYIYPVITIKDNNSSFSIQNISTGDKIMVLSGVSSISQLEIDCKNCIVSNLETGESLSFTQMGWTTVSDISWLRMLPGANELEITGSGSVTITYEMPYKKVGGWFE